MRHFRKVLALVFLLAFGLGLLIRLPLAWALPVLPRSVQCVQPGGTPWAGECKDFSLVRRAGPVSLGEVSWSLRPWRLLRARLAFDVLVRKETSRATALLQVAPGRLELLDVSGQGSLDNLHLPGLATGWGGLLRLEGLRLAVAGGKLAALDGTVSVTGLRSPGGADWGGYRLQFPRSPGSGLLPGSLQSIEGPLQFAGELVMSPEGAWQLEGRILARPDTDPALLAALDVLGPVDENGARHLSIADAPGR